MLIPTHAQAPLIDRDQFDMLIETGEDDAKEMIQELLDLFVGETAQKLEDLKQAAADDNRHLCNRIAHAIAGASANLGGLRLSAFARSYEAAAAEAPQQELREGADQMAGLYRTTVEAIAAEIQKL